MITEYIALTLGPVGTMMLAYKKKVWLGWLILTIGSIFWAITGYYAQMHGLMLSGTLYTFIQLYGMRNSL